MRRLVLFCIWTLMLTATPLSDSGDEMPEGSVGVIGLLKVGSRMAALALLAFVVVRTWTDLRRGAVMRHMLPWCTFGAWAVVSILWSPLLTFSLGQSASLVLLLMLSYCTAVLACRMRDVSQILWHLCFALMLLSTAFVAANLVAPGTFTDARESVTGGFHPTNASATAG